MADNELATKIGELGNSLAAIKETVGNLGSDLTAKVEQGASVSQELKDKTDKALSELGDVTTRLSDLERRAARANEAAEEGYKSLGQAFIESEKFRSTDVTGGWRGSIRVRSENAAITSYPATVGSNTSVGTSLVPADRQAGIVRLPMQKFTIRDLVATGRTDSNSIEYTRQVSRTNNAAVVSEGETKPYSDLTYELETAPVRTLAHLFKISRQMMDDAPYMMSEIDAEGTYGLKYVEEMQILKGDGTGQNLHGIIPQATAFAPAFNPAGETAIDRLRLAALQTVLSLYPASGFVLHPTDWARIETTKDNEGRYIVGNALSPIGPRLWGLPVAESMSMTPGTFLTGAFNIGAQIYDRMGVEVLLSTENADDFEKNLASVRIEERLAFAVKRPLAFVTGDIDTLTSAA